MTRITTRLRYRKKPSKRRTTRFRKLSSLNTPSGMPLIRTAKLRYNTSAQIASTSGLMAHHTMRANSLYDPDFTAVGHQPMGFDQWANLYNHYVVVGARLTVRFMNASGDASANPPYYAGVMLTDQSSFPYSNSSAVVESRKGISRMGAWLFPLRLTQNFSARGFYNLTDVKDNFDRIGAAVTASPAEEAFFQVWVQPVGSQTITLTADITVEYICKFSEPKDLAQS